MFTSPAEQEQLQREALAFAAQRDHSPEVERQQAMNNVEAAQQVDAAEESSFDAFHAAENANRAFHRFLKAHSEYVNCGENTAAMDAYIRANFDNEITLDTIMAAFASLAAAGQLKLRGEAQIENLDELSSRDLLHRQQEAEAQEAHDREADRKSFTKTGVKAAMRFVQLHPSYVVCPENLATMNQWFSEHGVNLDAPNLAQLNQAFEELYFAGALVVDESKKVAPAESEDSLYTMDKADLAKKAGTAETEPEYTPTPGFRFGSVGFTFEPGSQR